MIQVRQAQKEDLTTIKRLADDNRNALGFVLQARLEEHLRRQELLVCERQGVVAGFATFHHRRDRWTTIHEICVDMKLHRQGLGRILVKGVQKQAVQAGQVGIRLKCPLDLPANGFYARLGFTRVAIENGKCRPLAVWEKLLTQSSCPIVDVPAFFLTLTHTPSEIRQVVRLWDESGDRRNPFAYAIFTPLFSTPGTIAIIRQIKEERGSILMFDSGGYQVQMGKATYEGLFDRLLRFYRENDWADWYVLPDHVPLSTDSDHEVEFKVCETLDFARLFLRMMPKGFAERAVGVVHGRTEEQVRRCVNAYADMGVGYLGFGSFGTSGPNGTVNLISQQNLNLLQLVQTLAHERSLRLHIFGIGSPSHLTRLADAGVRPNSFDSAGWWKAGGFGKIFFPAGRQLHITRVDGCNATQRGIEREKQRAQHDCAFCADVSQLRQRRMMRVMHNLAVMLDVTERVGKS